MINFRPIFYVIGILLIILSLAMIIPAIFDLAANNSNWTSFALSSFLTAFFGIALTLTNQESHIKLNLKQAFILTNLSWLVVIIFATLPLYFSSINLTFVDAFFEITSGITTTGATILVGLDKMPPGILIWRALTHWMGGIGIIVVALAILPMLKIAGMQLFRTESSDRSDKILPRAGQIATGISVVYLLMTIVCTIMLWMSGMTLFDSICHAMSTVSTGGFSTHDASIGYYSNFTIELIIIFFMVAGAIPHVLYIYTLHGNYLAVFKDYQVIWFVRILLFSIFISSIWLIFYQDFNPFLAIRHSAFNITSIITTTGFATQNYSLWGSFALSFIFMISVVGGCTGSTSGGIKIFRFQILYQTAKIQIQQLFRPHAILKPIYNHKIVSEAVTSSVMSFVILFAVSFVILTLLLSLSGLDFLTAVSGSASSLANVGPGLGAIIGPAGTYASINDFAKILLAFGMILGRLEIFTVLVLFSAKFWED